MERLAGSVGWVLAAICLQAGLCLGASASGRPVSARERGRILFDGIAQSQDVADLECLAGSLEEAQKLNPPGGIGRHAKDVRIAAYARLGELGTTESLAAAERIEGKGRECSLVPDVVSLERWTSPTFHFGDGEQKPLATIEAPDGTTYGVILATFLMGADDFFLISTRTPDDKASWSRPKLVPGPAQPFPSESSLAFKSDGVLELALVSKSAGGNLQLDGNAQMPTPPAATRTLEIPIQQVLQDQDADGWTDLEELRLGLDPLKKDTDGDGIPDGQDTCPNFAPPAGSGNDEEALIVQKAVFAACGLTASRSLVLVGPQSVKVQLWGYGGPVIYLDDVNQWRTEHERGGMFLNWTVTRSGDEAEVRVSDYESPRAGGSQTVSLRKIDGKWYVTQRRTGGVA